MFGCVNVFKFGTELFESYRSSFKFLTLKSLHPFPHDVKSTKYFVHVSFLFENDKRKCGIHQCFEFVR